MKEEDEWRSGGVDRSSQGSRRTRNYKDRSVERWVDLAAMFTYNVGYREQVRKTLLPQLSVIRENRSFINKSKLKKVSGLFNINLLILVLF